jgi:hypothetical protein
MVTRNAVASRYSHLYRGVYPFHYDEQKPDFKQVPWQEDVDKRLKLVCSSRATPSSASRAGGVVSATPTLSALCPRSLTLACKFAICQNSS